MQLLGSPRASLEQTLVTDDRRVQWPTGPSENQVQQVLLGRGPSGRDLQEEAGGEGGGPQEEGGGPRRAGPTGKATGKRFLYYLKGKVGGHCCIS